MEALHRETLGDQLYKLLRRRILNGEFESGRHVTQVELAQEMGISRIPVRDALRRLENDVLLVGDEQGRFTVVTFGIKDAQELYAIRRRLEALALELAFDRMGTAQIGDLRELVEEMASAVEANRADDYIELDAQFHFAIYEACDSPRLMKIIKANWVGIPHLIPLKLPGRMRTSLAQHNMILERIESGDRSGALAALDVHIESAYQEWLADFRAREGQRQGPLPGKVKYK